MSRRDDRLFGDDPRAAIRTDDRVIVVLVLLLSVAVLVVLVYYAVAILEGLPELLPGVVRAA